MLKTLRLGMADTAGTAHCPLVSWQTTHASADNGVVSCVKCAAADDTIMQVLHILFAIIKDWGFNLLRTFSTMAYLFHFVSIGSPRIQLDLLYH